MTIRAALTRLPDHPFLADHQQAFSFDQIHQRCTQVAGELNKHKAARVACFMPDSIALISTMLGAAMGGHSLLVVNRDFSNSQLEEVLERFDVDLLVTESGSSFHTRTCTSIEAQALWEGDNPTQPSNTHEGEVLVLTSGTTGAPKCARYEWSDLLAQVPPLAKKTKETWLLAYRLNHFAGLQMLAHSLVHGSKLVVPESSKVMHAIDAIRNHGVTHVSSTPTFWRYALANLADNDETLDLKHITLGSEAVTGDILNRLHERFPEARLVHVYASTEAGSCVSVSDRLPGLPASILDRDDQHSAQFRVRDGELYIKSRHGMRGYVGNDTARATDENGWLATGDLVKVEGGRILFLGRRSETINVGGTKVHPLEIENVIAALPQVKLVRVFGQENPVVGEIVAVDVVPHASFTESEVENSVREACTVFGRAMRPRLINVVSTIATNNQKVARGK